MPYFFAIVAELNKRLNDDENAYIADGRGRARQRYKRFHHHLTFY